jgi:hypothetical protein
LIAAAPSQAAAAPVNTVKYFEFGVTPDALNQIALTSVQYTVAALSTPTWELRSSLDGFTANFGVHTIPLNATQHDFTDDISSLGTQTGTVTFRLYGYNSTGVNNDGLVNNIGTFGGDPGQNLIINGAVSAVPEPHQFALIAGLGLLVFAAFRQRHCLPKLA